MASRCVPHLLKARESACPNAVAAARHEGEWFARHTAYSMAKFGMSLVVLGMAGEFRDRGGGQRVVAAHDDRNLGGAKRAWRGRVGARLAHPRNSGGRGICVFSISRARIYRPVPDRRYVPRRKRRHRIRPLPRRPDAGSRGRFLRAGRQHRAGATCAPKRVARRCGPRSRTSEVGGQAAVDLRRSSETRAAPQTDLRQCPEPSY